MLIFITQALDYCFIRRVQSDSEVGIYQSYVICDSWCDFQLQSKHIQIHDDFMII